MLVVSYTVCPVGFVLISHVCPRSEEPVDGKGYCTVVPKVKVTLKKISDTSGATGWVSRVPLISIFRSPNWARLINFLLGERDPNRVSFGALAEEDFGNAGLQTQGTEGGALWSTASRALPALV